MIKTVKWGIIAMLVFMLVFNFLPTGTSTADLMENFTSMDSKSSNSVISQYVFVEETTAEDPMVGNLRDAIVQLNIDITLKYGNGYLADDGTDTRKLQNGKGILYSVDYSDVSSKDYGYAPFDVAKSSYDAMVSGTNEYMYFSCHGSCFFTWKYFWRDSPYALGGDVPTWINPGLGFGEDMTGGVITRVTSAEELVKIAEPGDILWYCTSTSTYAHSIMYLGDIEIDGHKITSALRNTGSSNETNDWVIRPLSYSQKHLFNGNRDVYVLSLVDSINHVLKNGGTAETQDWASGIEMPEVDPDDPTA